jgi:putative colanic acid biosynthesis UDP-glucose lipid carrier transferase
MSIIGPRPHATVHDDAFEADNPQYVHRRDARPGMSGLAQVSGCRGEVATPRMLDRRTRFDVHYVRNWSLFMDIKIALKTVTSILWDKNAY